MGNKYTKDDYDEYLNKAKIWENYVEKVVQSLGWNISRNDSSDCKLPDFSLNLCFELKYRRVAFRSAKNYVGLEPYEAIALDTNKLERYQNIQGAMILMIVDYTPEVKTKGLYLISVKKVAALMKRYGASRTHVYQGRRYLENPRNSKASFYVSVHECIRLPDVFMNLIELEMKKAQS